MTERRVPQVPMYGVRRGWHPTAAARALARTVGEDPGVSGEPGEPSRLRPTIYVPLERIGKDWPAQEEVGAARLPQAS